MIGIYRALQDLDSKVSNGLFCTASDVVRSSSGSAVTQTGTAYVKKKEIIASKTGTIRVGFTLQRTVGTGTVFGRVYINDIAVGTERSVASADMSMFFEDIAVKAGDRVQIYAKTSAASGTTAQVGAFTLGYDNKMEDLVVL